MDLTLGACHEIGGRRLGDLCVPEMLPVWDGLSMQVLEIELEDISVT
jgi:hypothetical protein